MPFDGWYASAYFLRTLLQSSSAPCPREQVPTHIPGQLTGQHPMGLHLGWELTTKDNRDHSGKVPVVSHNIPAIVYSGLGFLGLGWPKP
jgi:hypothetical protein